MNIPESVKINGMDYKVQRLAELTDGGDTLFGSLNTGKTLISLNNSNQTSQHMCSVLWHEMLHAVANNASLNLGDDEENIISAFSYGIYQILQDNKEALFGQGGKQSQNRRKDGL